MHWLSFFIGLFVGWLTEWIIDYFFWRRRSPATGETASGLQEKLSNIQAENEQLRTMWQESQAAKKDLATCLDELESQNSSLMEAQAEIETLREQLVAASAVGVVAAADFDSPEVNLVLDDDSALVEQSALDFSEVVESDDLVEIDNAVRGDEADLVAVVPDEPIEPDDLKKIEGIGPKIASILNDNSILTFAQLAQTEVDNLRAILQDAGPRFKLADPTTWPQQAQLAADGDWDRLQALQDRLKHGRHS